jgi:hypothetical protein
MRLAAVSLAFALVIFMCLTTLGVFGQAFSDSARHSIRDSADRLLTTVTMGEDAVMRAAQYAMSRASQTGNVDESHGQREANTTGSGENLN